LNFLNALPPEAVGRDLHFVKIFWYLHGRKTLFLSTMGA